MNSTTLKQQAASMTANDSDTLSLPTGLSIHWQRHNDQRSITLTRPHPAWPSADELAAVAEAFGAPYIALQHRRCIQVTNPKTRRTSRHNAISLTWREYQPVGLSR